MLQNTEEPIMTKAVRAVIDMSHDTQVREAARLREKSILDARSEMKIAKDEGIAIGRAEGRVEGRAEGRVEGRVEGVELGREQLIQQLLHAGFPEEELHKYLSTQQ